MSKTNLINAITQIKAQTKDKVKEESQELLINQLNSTEEDDYDKNVLVEALMTALDHLKTSKETSQITAIRTITLLIPEFVEQEIDVATSLMLAFIFTDFQIESDTICDEILLFCQSLIENPSLFINDLQVLYVQKIAGVLSNTKVSLLRKSNFERLTGAFVDFLSEKEESLMDVFVEYLESSISGSAQEFRLCEKQVVCVNPVEAMGIIYNSNCKELEIKALEWPLSNQELTNNIKIFSSGLARDAKRDTSMQLYNVFAGKSIRGTTALLQGVYHYFVFALSIELERGEDLCIEFIQNVGLLDNPLILSLGLLFAFLYLREQSQVSTVLFEEVVNLICQYFLKEKLFENQTFETIGQTENIRQYLHLSEKEVKLMGIPDSMTLQGILEPNIFAEFMVQRDPDCFVAFLYFVSFEQCSSFFWNNRVASLPADQTRLGLMEVHNYFLNTVQSNPLVAYSFDELFAIALQLDKCGDSENVRVYLEVIEGQLSRFLGITHRPCIKPIFTAEGYIYKIMTNLLSFLAQLGKVPNFIGFHSIIFSLLLGVVVTSSKTTISSIDIQDVMTFIFEQQEEKKLGKNLSLFLKSFSNTYDTGTDKHNSQRTIEISDLEGFFLGLLELSFQDVDMLYNKVIMEVFLNESQKIFDVNSLFVLLRVFQSGKFREYLAIHLAVQNEMLKSGAMRLLISCVSYQLLLEDGIREPVSNDVIHKLIYESRLNTSHQEVLEGYRTADFINSLESILNENTCAANEEEISIVFLKIFEFSETVQVPIKNTEIERRMVFFLELAALSPSDGLLCLVNFVVGNQTILHGFEITTKEFLRSHLFEMIENLNHGKFSGNQKELFDEDALQKLPLVFCKNIDDTPLVMEMMRACEEFIEGAKMTAMITKLLFGVIQTLPSSFVYTKGEINGADLVVLFDFFVVNTMLKMSEQLQRQENEAKRNRYLDVETQLFVCVKDFVSSSQSEVEAEFVYIFDAYALLFKNCLENELQELYFDVLLRMLSNPRMMKVLLNSEFRLADLNVAKLSADLDFIPHEIEVMDNDKILCFLDQLIEQVDYQYFSDPDHQLMIKDIIEYCTETKLYLPEVFDVLHNELFLIDEHDSPAHNEDYLLDSEQDQEEGRNFELTANRHILLMLHSVVKQMGFPQKEIWLMFKAIFNVEHIGTERFLLYITSLLLPEAPASIQLDLLTECFSYAISSIDMNELSASFWSSLIGTILTLSMGVMKDLDDEQQERLISAAISLSECLLIHTALEFYGPRCDMLFFLAQMREMEIHAETVEEPLYALISSFTLQLTPNCAAKRQSEGKLLLGRRLDCNLLGCSGIFQGINAGLSPAFVSGSSVIDLSYLNANLLNFCFETLERLEESAAEFVLRLYEQVAANYVIESELCGSCPMRLGNAALDYFAFAISKCFGDEHVKHIFKASLDLLAKGKDVERYRTQLLSRLAEVI